MLFRVPCEDGCTLIVYSLNTTRQPVSAVEIFECARQKRLQGSRSTPEDDASYAMVRCVQEVGAQRSGPHCLGVGDELSVKISVQSHLLAGDDVLRLYMIFAQRTSARQDIWKPGLGTALSL